MGLASAPPVLSWPLDLVEATGRFRQYLADHPQKWRTKKMSKGLQAQIDELNSKLGGYKGRVKTLEAVIDELINAGFSDAIKDAVDKTEQRQVIGNPLPISGQLERIKNKLQ